MLALFQTLKMVALTWSPFSSTIFSTMEGVRKTEGGE
jgi:hypothetical protein